MDHLSLASGARWTCTHAAVAVCLSLGLSPLNAQQLPSSAEPGRKAPLPTLVTPTVPPAAPVVTPGGSVTQAPPGADQLTFTLNEMAIEGVTAYSADVLRSFYADLLGKKISVADAFRVAGDIERRYRGDGFITSRVIVPEQAVDGGRFRIVVVEGFIADMVYEGQIGEARAAVDKLLSPLRGKKPINVAEVERRLLLANDLPGLTVRGSLEPSPTVVGGSVMVVRSTRRPVDASVSMDNRASPYMGSREVMASLAWNAVGDPAGRFSLSGKQALQADRSMSVQLGYDALLTDQGLTLGLSSSLGTSHPGRELEPLDVRSAVVAMQGTVTYPWIRSREENLRAVGQFEARQVDTHIAGVEFTHDRLHIVRVGMSYDRTDTWNGITAARAMLHKGVPGLGSTPTGSTLASRAGGRSDFTKLTADITRLQQVTERSSVVATLTGQWTPDALLASEELALGGASFGRAYDDGEVAAANGVALSVEWRYALPVMPLVPQGAQVYAFWDAGKVRAAGDAVAPAKTSLTSMGTGVRANVSSHVFATLELAQPIGAVVGSQGNKNLRAFFSLTAQY